SLSEGWFIKSLPSIRKRVRFWSLFSILSNSTGRCINLAEILEQMAAEFSSSAAILAALEVESTGTSSTSLASKYSRKKVLHCRHAMSLEKIFFMSFTESHFDTNVKCMLK